MAIVLKLRQALIIDDCVEVGDPNNSTTLTDLTAGTSYGSQELVVEDAFGTATLWETTQGGFTTFEKAFIFSDADLAVELRTDNGTPEYILMFIRANELVALPALLGGNTTQSIDGAILVQGTDYDNCDRIMVQRDVADAAGDATVSLFLFQ